MNRALIEKPFPREMLRTRRGPFGQDITYVEAAHYVRRLNEAFDGVWSWRVLSHDIRGSEVIVHGILEAGGQVKAAFGGSPITTSRQTGEVVSVADDLKAASTDALKKACSLLGIGLDLYLSRPEEHSSGERRAHLRPVPGERSAPADPRLTAKQLKALYAIAHAQGMSDAELRSVSQETYGVVPEQLSRRDASALIDSLSER
jgi:hypothetical protein